MGRLNGYRMILQFNNSYKRAPATMFMLLISVLLFDSFTVGLSEIRWYKCKNDTRYLHESKYESNLNRVLDDLVKNAASSGFNTTSYGENAEDKVYGLLQCRGDVSPQDCSKISQEAIITIQQLCVNAMGGRLWLDACFLGYDNFSFFSDFDAHVKHILSNPQTVKDNPGGFRNEVVDLLQSLKDKAFNVTSKGFALGSATSSSSDTQKVFGLVDCWRDLSLEQCRSCLSIALLNLYNTTMQEGAEALLGNCRVRFETHPFSPLFASNGSTSQISPKKSSKTLAILCGVIGGGLLAFSVCLYLMRKRMRSVLDWAWY